MTKTTPAAHTTPSLVNTPADLLRDAAFVLRLTGKVKAEILAGRSDPAAPTTYPPARPAVEKAATGTAC